MGYYGNINVGHVADCNKERLERMLKDYDNQLYIRWDAKRKNGRGCWQIRRRPNDKTQVYQGHYQGQPIFTAEYVEEDLTHHVLDVEVLSYDLVGKIKSMDAWNEKHFINDLEYLEDKASNEARKKNQEDLKYHMKQYRRTWRDMKEALASGQSLGQLLKGFKLD